MTKLSHFSNFYDWKRNGSAEFDGRRESEALYVLRRAHAPDTRAFGVGGRWWTEEVIRTLASSVRPSSVSPKAYATFL